MATGGTPKGDEMIRPLDEAQEPCKSHAREYLRVFCEDCCMLICLLCSLGEHKGHKATLAAEKVDDIMENLKALNKPLEKRKKDALQLVEEKEKKRDKIKKDFEEAKRKYEADMKTATRAIDEAQGEVTDVKSLQKDVGTVNSSSALSGVLSLHKKVTSFLGQTLPRAAEVAGLRSAVKALLPTTPRKYKKRYGDVAVPISFYNDCKDLIDRHTDTPPGSPQWPNRAAPLKFSDNTTTEVALIPPADAARLLHLTGGSAQLTLGRVNLCSALLTQGGTVKFIYIKVNERSGKNNRDLGCWMMPAAMELGAAVREATGQRPRRLTDEYCEEEFPLTETCEDWRRKTRYALYAHF